MAKARSSFAAPFAGEHRTGGDAFTSLNPEKLLNRTDYRMVSKNPDFPAAIPPVLVAENLQPEYEVPLWTDKYSNLFRILKK